MLTYTKIKSLSHDEYPFISLMEARALRDQAREQIKKGETPSTNVS